MIRIKLIFCIFLVSGLTTCRSQSYNPLKEGNKWTLQFLNLDLVLEAEVLKGRHEYNGIEYFQIKRLFSWGTADTTFLRIDGEGGSWELNPKSLKETISIPAKAQPGKSWVSTYDGQKWQFEIFSLGGILEAPGKTFTDCLVIKAEQILDRDPLEQYIRYDFYAKGIGYVGSKNQKGLECYLSDFELK